MPVYPYPQESDVGQGLDIMFSVNRHWLEHDPVTLVVLLVGISSVTALVLSI